MTEPVRLDSKAPLAKKRAANGRKTAVMGGFTRRPSLVWDTPEIDVPACSRSAPYLLIWKQPTLSKGASRSLPEC